MRTYNKRTVSSGGAALGLYLQEVEGLYTAFTRYMVEETWEGACHIHCNGNYKPLPSWVTIA